MRSSSLMQGSEIKKILILRLDRIGDIVLSTPAIRALREHFKESHIAVMTNEKYKELLLNDPNISEIIGYKSILTFNFIKGLRKKRFDLVVDLIMDRSLKSALLAYLIGAPYRIGYDIAGRGIFFNIKVLPSNDKKHLVENTLDVVRQLGIVSSDNRPQLRTTSQSLAAVKAFLSSRGLNDEEILVGIHPGGYYPSQRWCIERFASVSDEIIRKYNAKVVLIAGPKEGELINKAVSLMQEKAIAVRDFTLENLMALIRRFQLLICNNSGPLHIACAVGVPTISTMGPTLPWRWWPVGENHIVLRKELPCSPCEKGFCKTHECMKLITVDEMLEAVDRQMKLLVKNRCAESTV